MNDINLANQIFDISNAAFEKKVDKYYKKFIKIIDKGIAKNCRKGLYSYDFDRSLIPPYESCHDFRFQNAIEALLKEYYKNQGFKVYIGIFWIEISWDNDKLEEKPKKITPAIRGE